MKNNTSILQRGYTLIEMSIGLTIVALVTVGVLSGVQRLMDTYALNKTVEQVADAVERIKRIIKNDTTTEFVTETNLLQKDYNAFVKFTVNGTTIQTATGGSLTLSNNTTPDWGATQNTQTFRVFLFKINEAQCAELAGQLEGIARGVIVRTGGGGWSSWVKDKDTVFSASAARTACALKGADGALTLEIVK